MRRASGRTIALRACKTPCRHRGLPWCGRRPGGAFAFACTNAPQRVARAAAYCRLAAREGGVCSSEGLHCPSVALQLGIAAVCARTEQEPEAAPASKPMNESEGDWSGVESFSDEGSLQGRLPLTSRGWLQQVWRDARGPLRVPP
jgi:hypothetical protein